MRRPKRNGKRYADPCSAGVLLARNRGRNRRLNRDGKWREVNPIRIPIEAPLRYGGPWKPAELSDEPADGAPMAFMAGIDEPLAEEGLPERGLVGELMVPGQSGTPPK